MVSAYIVGAAAMLIIEFILIVLWAIIRGAR